MHIGDDWVWGCMFGGGWKLVPSGIKYVDVDLVFVEVASLFGDLALV